MHPTQMSYIEVEVPFAIRDLVDALPFCTTPQRSATGRKTTFLERASYLEFRDLERLRYHGATAYEEDEC